MYGGNNSHYGNNFGGSPMGHRGGQPLNNMQMGNGQNMPFGQNGGFPGQMGGMNSKMPGMGGFPGQMGGQFGAQGMQPGMQRPQMGGPGADKENGMNSYGLSPQMGNLGLRGGANQPGMCQQQQPGMRPGMGQPGMNGYPGMHPQHP
jgi:hypothetical protein